jgi:hypothetical protein
MRASEPLSTADARKRAGDLGYDAATGSRTRLENDREEDMATGVDTLVSQRMRDARGVWSEFGQPAPPISESDIRRWVIAVYWPERPPPLYWDPDYAKTTRWGGIIAPPEFNPFAWPIREAGAKRAGRVDMPQPGEPGQNIMNGGSVMTFGAIMRPGDRIRSRHRLADWMEREGRFGLMLFSHTETEWRNQDDEQVRLTVSTLIRH